MWVSADQKYAPYNFQQSILSSRYLDVMKKSATFFSSLAPDGKPAPSYSSPNIQSGKYNEMDPILIGTAVSEHVIKEMSKPAVPLVKALWRTIISSIFMITSWLIINVAVVERRKQEIRASSLTYRNIPQNALSLLDNSLNIQHFGMWKVDWLSWRLWFYSGTKFAPWS